MHGRGRGGPYVPADHRVQTMLAAQERQQQNVAAVKARAAPRPGAALPQHSWPPSALRSAISFGAAATPAAALTARPRGAGLSQDGRQRQMEATWVSKTGEVVARVNARERCACALRRAAARAARACVPWRGAAF
jgi:hypothetical protein